MMLHLSSIIAPLLLISTICLPASVLAKTTKRTVRGDTEQERTVLRVMVPRGGEQCFFYTVEQHRVMEIHFQGLKGASMDVDLDWYGPSGNLFMSEKRTQEAQFFKKAEKPGEYKFCFGNKFSLFSDKWVEFSLTLSGKLDKPEAKDNQLSPAEEAALPIVEALDRVSQTLYHAQSFQRLTRNHAIQDAERLNYQLFHVTWVSLAELSLIVGVGFLQLYFLKSLFAPSPVPSSSRASS